MATTLVAPEPQSLPNQRAWPNQPQVPQQGVATAPTQLLPAVQSVPNQGADPWSNLHAPEPWFNTADPLTLSPKKPRSKVPGVIAWTLWAFAGGLFAAPHLTEHVDQGFEAGVSWVATWAPSFLRPYLPAPLEALAPASPHSSSERMAVAVPTA
ncbi:MAG: hypothetical protein ACK2U9_17095, partial [Anaerolineae bacterium]